MSSYGLSHFVPLAVFLVGAVAVVLVGRRHRAADGPTAFSRTGALLIPAVTVPFQLIDFTTNFDIDVTLPLHLCDLAWVAAAIALWSHHPFAVALTFFWGLVLTSQAVITPSLGQDFPEPRYFAYWCLHLLILWAALYLVFGLGKVPRWQDYRWTVAATAVWAAAAYAFNLVADTNYGYLMEKPNGSILDLLGPWPWYVFIEIVLVAGVWALLTLFAQAVTMRPSRESHRPRERSLPS